MTLFTILFTAALVNNFVLSQFLGICPFLGVSKKVQTAAGMGGAVIFVITIASLITSTLYNLLLKPNDLAYLNTIVFILVIAALVQFVEMFMKKSMKGLYQALGVYLPLITTNCAVLGVALLSVQNEDSILEATVRGIGASVGFFLAMVLMAGIREKLENSNIPSAMKGTPIVLITAGLMAIAFCGFGGVSF
ncbi:MAG: RnfABCDGE type electron transport complex subunit A [Eubacterium sp.]|nr:RnfABCDGE type electron transport complex subunit A [Eubacterium sp.]